MTEENFKKDSKEELNWILSQFTKHSEIYLYGRSLGGAIALYLGSTEKKYIKGLIIENTFSSFLDLARSTTWFNPYLKWLSFMPSWNSEEIIKTIDLPILFISGRKDKAIPPAQMDKLYISAGESKHKEMFKVEDGAHDDTCEHAGDEYFERILDFMEYEYI